MTGGDRAGEFERWLDRELGRAVATGLGAGERPVRPAYLDAARGKTGPLAGVLAGLGVKGAAAIGAAALALAGGGAALATGSPNPLAWGQQAVQAVVARQHVAPTAVPGAGAGGPATGRPQPEPSARHASDAPDGAAGAHHGKAKSHDAPRETVPAADATSVPPGRSGAAPGHQRDPSPTS